MVVSFLKEIAQKSLPPTKWQNIHANVVYANLYPALPESWYVYFSLVLACVDSITTQRAPSLSKQSKNIKKTKIKKSSAAPATTTQHGI